MKEPITLRPNQYNELVKLMKLVTRGCLTETEMANQAWKIAEVFHDDLIHIFDDAETQSPHQ
jgi:hypothetical protein